MNIAFIGPACAGKSTQAARLARPFELRHLSTGKLLRDHFERHTALGILAKKYVASGDLVPDDLVDAMVEENAVRMAPNEGFLLDAFPSTLHQARFIDEMFRSLGRKLDAVYYISIPDQMVFERASERFPKRADDTVEILTNRLRVFRRNVAPVLDYFSDSGRLGFIDGSGTIDEVYNKLMLALGDILAGQRLTLSTAQHDLLQNLGVSPTTPVSGGGLKSLNLVLLGGPGSGKGTQAEHISTTHRIPHISTGDLFRNDMEKETELGKIARAYIDHGDLVPDDVTEAMVRRRLREPDCATGFLLDGFPRTLPQAHALEEILAEMNRQLSGVVSLEVPDDSIVERLSGRRICRECKRSFHVRFHPFTACPESKCHGEHLSQRDDDTTETILNRLKKFHLQTAPLISYYRKAGQLAEIVGTGELDDVRDRITEAVETFAERG